MEMFNRLKSTVGGLIGNPVVGQYDITGLIATGGLNCLWKIYHGVKRSTKQVCMMRFNRSLATTSSTCCFIVTSRHLPLEGKQLNRWVAIRVIALIFDVKQSKSVCVYALRQTLGQW